MARFSSVIAAYAASCVFLFGCGTASVVSAGASSDTDKQTWNVRVIPLYNYAMVTALPASWPNKPAVKEKEEFSYNAEFFPEEETPGDRTQKITLNAYYGVDLTPDGYAKNTLSAIERVCGKEHTARQTIEQTDNSITFVTFCGESQQDLPGKDGLKKGVGEIVLSRVDRQENSLYVIYHSWRGDSFNTDKKYEKDFPVSLKSIKKRAEVMRATMYCNRKEPRDACKKFSKFF